MLVAEKNIFKHISIALEPSWVVTYLEKDQFTSGHVRVLRAKANISDKVLSSILNLAPKTFVSYTKDISKTR